ncbi:MAG: amino acid permease [Gemmatimonadota bacterium]
MAKGLERALGTRDLTLLVVGNVIGSGIFLVPSTVLAQAGSVRWAMGAWLFGGVLSLFGALTYGELGAMDKGSGGLYAYIRDAFGPFLAFIYGWTLFFVIGSGTIATLAVAAANYMSQFAPLGPLVRKLIAIGLLALMAVINILGTRRSANVQNVATLIKAGAIVVMSVVLLALGNVGSAFDALPTSMAGSTSALAALGVAMISVLWAYEGWQYVTFSAGEATDPQRSFPRAIALGTLFLIVLYLVANLAYLAALGPERVAVSERVAGEAVAATMGAAAGQLIALVIIISMYSAAHATVITSPRVYFTMAGDGLFFRRLAEVHPRYGTPAFAIGANCVWAMVLAATGTFEQLLTYVVFVGWIFYGLGAASIFVFRRRRPDTERPFRVPGYPWTPALFVLSAVALVLNTIVEQPVQAAIGIGVVLLGAPAYLVWRGRPG